MSAEPVSHDTTSASRRCGIKVVLFDLGHTLVHSDRRHAREVVHEVGRALHREVTNLGFHPPSLETYIRAAKWRLLTAAVWSRIVRREVQVIELIRRAHECLGIHLDAGQTRELVIHGAIAIGDLFHLDPEAPAMLDALRQRGYRLGLISNTWLPGPVLDGYLKHEGLLDYFPIRVYSSEVRFMKPNPRIFAVALDILQVPPSSCVFVGDRLDNDIRGAGRLGMRTVHLAMERRHVWRPGRPDHVIHRLGELPALLSSWA